MTVIGIMLLLDEDEWARLGTYRRKMMNESNKQRIRRPSVKEIFLQEMRNAGLNPIRLGADILKEGAREQHHSRKKISGKKARA